MTTFTLLVIPGGRAMLTTTEKLSDAEIARCQQIARDWKNGAWPLVIVDDVDVVQVSEIDLDLTPAPVGAMS